MFDESECPSLTGFTTNSVAQSTGCSKLVEKKWDASTVQELCLTKK